MNIELNELEVGKWRSITAEELEILMGSYRAKNFLPIFFCQKK